MAKKTGTHDIFISYSRDDKDEAINLVRQLESSGFSTWWDGDIQPGEDFASTINDKINSAKSVVVLWSKNSKNSAGVKSEATIANAGGKYIGVKLEPNVDVPVEFSGSTTISVPGSQIKGALRAAFQQHGISPGLQKFGLELENEVTPKSKGFAFISHAEEDVPVVEDIAGFLAKRRYAYWAFYKSKRNYQKATHLEIEERLLQSVLMLSVLSPEWKKSTWTMRELWFAREINKPLFLLMFRDPGPTLAIAGDTYIDFRVDREEGFRRLGDELNTKSL